MQDVVNTLESMGEVNIKLSMHDSTKSDTGGLTFTPTDPVCFVLDPPKEKRKKASFLVMTISFQTCSIRMF